MRLDVLCGIATAGISPNAKSTVRWENVNTSLPNGPLRMTGIGISLLQKQRHKQHKKSKGQQRTK